MILPKAGGWVSEVGWRRPGLAARAGKARWLAGRARGLGELGGACAVKLEVGDRSVAGKEARGRAVDALWLETCARVGTGLETKLGSPVLHRGSRGRESGRRWWWLLRYFHTRKRT